MFPSGYPDWTTPSWEQRKLGDCFEFLKNNTLSRADLNGENGTARNVHYGDILIKFGDCLDGERSDLPFITDDTVLPKFAGSILREGDVIFADTAEDEAAGKCVELRKLPKEPTISGLHTIPARPRSPFGTGYLGHYLNSDAYHRQLLPLMQGIKVISVSKAALQDTQVRFPGLSEQTAIGAALSEIDNLITLHQRKCQYRGLYEYLSWEQRKLGEFSKKRTTKNADGALSETFTNSAEQGVINQLDYFDHDITNDANISGYYVVQPDDFVYNPRISATAPCGPINRNRLDRAGVMSPLYTVFSVDASVDKTYLEHYFKTSRWHDFMFLEGNSGARSDRFSISDATFFEMQIWCPEISEQKAIAKQLETADHLITLHQ
ncbi:MAG: restriction endonuclease subunit S [Paratractidigestivibacter faecalis]